MAQPEIGHWTWVELMTRERRRAEDFYGAMLGWTFTYDDAMSYGMASNGTRNVAGLFDFSALDELSAVPANWSPYLEVADVDAAVAAGTTLGGSTVRAPWDIDYVGRIAVVNDPMGANLNLMRGADADTEQPPRGQVTEHGDWHWWELRTQDSEKAKAYYAELAGWTFIPGPDATMAYEMGVVGERPVAGIWNVSGVEFMAGVPSHWMGFLAVDDVDKAFETGTANGGQAMGPLMDMPNVGRMGLMRDPEGAVLGLITPAQR